MLFRYHNGILLFMYFPQIYNLASSNDPMITLCEEDYIGKLKLPAYVPVSDLKSAVCSTDWDSTIKNITKSTSAVETMIEKVYLCFVLYKCNFEKYSRGIV